ncbi:hypothetical protein ISN45_Aa03g036880, partial [Arabidopsis thaliana x Arabidopsis arenosa]
MEGDFKGVSTTATDSFNLPILTSLPFFPMQFLRTKSLSSHHTFTKPTLSLPKVQL